MKRIGITVIAALGAWVGLGSMASPARAQICGDLFDGCEIAEEVFEWNISEFEDFFALDEKTCDKMTNSFFKQCEDAVSAAVKCWKNQFNAIPKTAKPACKTEGDASGACNDDYKEDAATEKDGAEEAEAFALDCCVDFAELFFDACLGNPI